MEIITGYTGENHVTSADDASLYRGILGQDDYVLEAGSKFAATIIDNNTVRVMDGDLVIQGHQARIRSNDYNEVTIDNGTAGQKRHDLIVARYLKNTETGIESITLEVVKGTPGATATDPEILQEDLKVGGTQRDYPLYRVSLNGLALENVTSLFTTIPNLKVFKTHLADKAKHSMFKRNTNQSIPSDVISTVGWHTQTNYNDADFCTLNPDGAIIFNQKGLYEIVMSLQWEDEFMTQLYPGSRGEICFSNSEIVIGAATFQEYDVGNLWGGRVLQNSGGAKNILATTRTALIIRQVAKL